MANTNKIIALWTANDALKDNEFFADGVRYDYLGVFPKIMEKVWAQHTYKDIVTVVDVIANSDSLRHLMELWDSAVKFNPEYPFEPVGGILFGR